MKKFFFLTVAMMMLAGCASTQTVNEQNDAASQNQQAFTQKTSLYQTTTDGTEQATGLVVTKDWDPPYYVPLRMLISPDNEKVLFNRWENVHIVLYISNIDGSSQQVIAEQSVPEGSGELDIWSLEWVDNKHVKYTEGGLFCLENTPCEGPADFVSKTMTYRVNIDSLKKELVE